MLTCHRKEHKGKREKPFYMFPGSHQSKGAPTCLQCFREMRAETKRKTPYRPEDRYPFMFSKAMIKGKSA